jgi:hypothetical protein
MHQAWCGGSQCIPNGYPVVRAKELWGSATQVVLCNLWWFDFKTAQKDRWEGPAGASGLWVGGDGIAASCQWGSSTECAGAQGIGSEAGGAAGCSAWLVLKLGQLLGGAAVPLWYHFNSRQPFLVEGVEAQAGGQSSVGGWDKRMKFGG